jgi:hypothetical protein
MHKQTTHNHVVASLVRLCQKISQTIRTAADTKLNWSGKHTGITNHLRRPSPTCMSRPQTVGRIGNQVGRHQGKGGHLATSKEGPPVLESLVLLGYFSVVISYLTGIRTGKISLSISRMRPHGPSLDRVWFSVDSGFYIGTRQQDSSSSQLNQCALPMGSLMPLILIILKLI